MKIECKVCGCEFNPIIERHYISRSEGKTGIVAAFSENSETKLFDTFDCPQCGCQIIAKQRQREYVAPILNEGRCSSCGDCCECDDD